jgi:hypothetical protein
VVRIDYFCGMMKADTIRKKIIKKVEKANESELDRISNYIDNLRSKEKRKKELLAYAGLWRDLPKNIFADLTINLPKRRAGRRNVLS